jgi:hypothetical protein
MLSGKQGGIMTDADKLRRDIETLLESIRLDWKDVAEGRVSRTDAIKHIDWCIDQLRELINA